MNLIIKLIKDEQGLAVKELYQALKKHGHKDRNKNGGLGHVFVEDHYLVTEALSINHSAQTVSLKSPEKLLELANAFRAQEKEDVRQGIKQNLNKHLICLAMLYNLTPQTRAGIHLKHQALSGLNESLSKNNLFKNQTFFNTNMSDLIAKKRLMLESLYDFLPQSKDTEKQPAFRTNNNS